MKLTTFKSIGAAALVVAGMSACGGEWITDAALAALEPRPVCARELKVGSLPPKGKTRNVHVLFRKDFELTDKIASAKVRITADDYYKLYVNGTFAGQGPAAGVPEHTYLNEIDVTPLLRPGRNVLAVHTYYQGLVNRVWRSGDNRHGLLLDLVADGRTLVSSDATFRTARHGAYSAMGIVGYDTQFMERYDAGAAEVGFERPDFDDSGWAFATVHPHGGDYAVFPQPTPMLEIERIAPVKVERLADGALRLDFGGVYVGSLELAATGPRGAEVEMRFGQELLADGSVRHRLRANCTYVEKFVLSGKGRDTLDQFDYKSFRYAELIPAKGAAIDAASVRIRARHMPFTLRAKPTFSDPAFEPIWRLCVDSFRYGVQEQIQDCMEREKGYYLGDGCYTMLTYCRLTGEWGWARRFVDDFLRTASIDRGLVTCANCSLMQEIAEYPLMFIWFVNRYLEETGDVAFVRSRFAALADILDVYRERYARPDGLLRNLDKWCVVEWPANFQDGYDADVAGGKVCTDLHNVVNAWYAVAVKELNAIAARIGEPRRFDVAEKAFQDVFYDRTRHLFVDREGSRHVSLPGNVYAAFAGLAPADDRAAHHAAFVRLVREKGYSSISMFQFFPLFCWLRENGEEALMNELILSPDAWKRNLREGATRTFEGWGRDTKWNTSLFHLTIASVAWFLCQTDPVAAPDVRGRWVAVPMVDRDLLASGYPGGEGCQWVTCIATGGRDGRLAVMGTDTGGIHRSTDEGRTWEPATLGYNSRGAVALAVDPADPDRVLAVGSGGRNSGLFLSEDAGATWRQVLERPLSKSHDYRAQLGFDPASGCAYWASFDDGLYRSDDRGSAWTKVPGGAPASGGEIAVDAHGNLLAGTKDGLRLSTDRGATWRTVLDGEIRSLAAPRAHGGRIWVLTTNALVVAASAEGPFLPSEARLPESAANNFRRLAVSPHDPNLLLMQDDTLSAGKGWAFTCWRSADGGRTWRTCEFDPRTNMWTPLNTRPRTFAFSPRDARRILSYCSDAVYASVDGGDRFVCSSAGYNAILVASETFFNVNDPNLIAVSSQDYNGALSADNGRTWRYVNWSGLKWGGYTYGAYRLDRDTAVAGVSEHWRSAKGNVIRIAVTHDGGATVERTGHVITGATVACGAKGDPARVFIGEWISRDGARTWTRMDGCTGVLFCDPVTGRLLGVNGPSIVWSDDNGESWRTALDRSGEKSSVASLAYDRETDRVYFAHWSWNLRAFTLDPRNPRPPVSEVLPGVRHVCSIAVDPIEPSILYAACHADLLYTMENVWRSADRGATWQGLCRQPGDGREGPDGANQAIHVTVNPVTREPFVFTHCNGVWRFAFAGLIP